MSKVPEQEPRKDQAIAGGVTNEMPPDLQDKEGVRRRDDLTIRGADPKELDPPPQMSERTGRQIK